MLQTIVKAKKHIAHARKISSRAKSPFKAMTEDQIIAKIRRDRDAIWDSRHALRS